jgi:hypothetical protein
MRIFVRKIVLFKRASRFHREIFAAVSKIFYDAISIRCLRLSDAVLLRTVDSGLIFTPLLACGRAVAHCVKRPRTFKKTEVFTRSFGAAALHLTMRRLRLREPY